MFCSALNFGTPCIFSGAPYGCDTFSDHSVHFEHFLNFFLVHPMHVTVSVTLYILFICVHPVRCDTF